VVLAGCAKAAEPATSSDAPIAVDSGGGDVINQCPPGELATDVGLDGQVTCAPLEAPTQQALDDRCSMYLGWRDDCNGCTTPPAKWGQAGATCLNGAGADNTCTTQSLGGNALQLFGLNVDGDFDGNDKLYGSLHCVTAEPGAGSLAPCKAGELVSGKLGSSWTCAPFANAVVDYVRASCSVYLGWQDNCDGCSTAPAKSGRAGDGSCENLAGTDNTCSLATLGETVNLFGLNPDGDVDGNDKLHAGLHCIAPAADGATSTTVCPPNQFVAGTLADGSFRCESPAPLIARYFTDHCSLTFGWQDNCNGCTTPPTKWGQVRVGTCTEGAGADDTCTRFTLGGQAIELFGLNPDGDVDGNDTLYVGFQCF
jgi:hypothetical protein